MYCNPYKVPKYLEHKLSIVCHVCKCTLYEGCRVNSYSGGPFICGNCGADVTEDLYGKDYKNKTKPDEKNNP